MTGDVDAGARAVAAGEPAAFGAGDVSGAVELRRGLAEVPDVPASVLRIPVRGSLLEPPGEVEPVADGCTSDALNRSRRVEDVNDVTCDLAVLDPAIEVSRTGRKR